MYAVTSRFLTEIRRGYTAVTYVDFIRRGDVVAQKVPVLSGDVSEDKSASVRRTCSLGFSGASSDIVLPLATEFRTSPFWPIGNEVKVWAGLQYFDGTEELVPQGVFRVTKPTIKHADGDLSIGLQGYDRSRAVARARFTQPYTIAKGTDYATAIKTLIQSRITLSDTDFIFMVTDGSTGGSIYTTPDLLFLDQADPWKAALDMAASFGAEIFFDGDGRCVLRPEPDPLFNASAFDYVAGETATMTELNRDLDDEYGYNGMIVVGQTNDNTTAIPRGEAWDTNPASPTYYDPARPTDSLYGAVPQFYSSDYITTDAQAAAAASSLLLSVTGIMENVGFSAISNPAHQGGDVLRIADPMAGVDGMYLLDSFRFGLGPEGVMSGTTRRRRVV